MAFSSDFIVGYPGETENDFDQTIDLIEQVGLLAPILSNIHLGQEPNHH